MNVNTELLENGLSRSQSNTLNCRICKKTFMLVSELQKHQVKHYRKSKSTAEPMQADIDGHNELTSLKSPDSTSCMDTVSPCQKDSGIDDCSPLSSEGFIDQSPYDVNSKLVYPTRPMQYADISSANTDSLPKDCFIDLTQDSEDESKSRSKTTHGSKTVSSNKQNGSNLKRSKQENDDQYCNKDPGRNVDIANKMVQIDPNENSSRIPILDQHQQEDIRCEKNTLKNIRNNLQVNKFKMCSKMRLLKFAKTKEVKESKQPKKLAPLKITLKRLNGVHKASDADSSSGSDSDASTSQSRQRKKKRKHSDDGFFICLNTSTEEAIYTSDSENKRNVQSSIGYESKLLSDKTLDTLDALDQSIDSVGCGITNPRSGVPGDDVSHNQNCSEEISSPVSKNDAAIPNSDFCPVENVHDMDNVKRNGNRSYPATEDRSSETENSSKTELCLQSCSNSHNLVTTCTDGAKDILFEKKPCQSDNIGCSIFLQTDCHKESEGQLDHSNEDLFMDLYNDENDKDVEKMDVTDNGKAAEDSSYNIQDSNLPLERTSGREQSCKESDENSNVSDTANDLNGFGGDEKQSNCLENSVVDSTTEIVEDQGITHKNLFESLSGHRKMMDYSPCLVRVANDNLFDSFLNMNSSLTTSPVTKDLSTNLNNNLLINDTNFLGELQSNRNIFTNKGTENVFEKFSINKTVKTEVISKPVLQNRLENKEENCDRCQKNIFELLSKDVDNNNSAYSNATSSIDKGLFKSFDKLVRKTEVENISKYFKNSSGFDTVSCESQFNKFNSTLPNSVDPLHDSQYCLSSERSSEKDCNISERKTQETNHKLEEKGIKCDISQSVSSKDILVESNVKPLTNTGNFSPSKKFQDEFAAFLCSKRKEVKCSVDIDTKNSYLNDNSEGISRLHIKQDIITKDEPSHASCAKIDQRSETVHEDIVNKCNIPSNFITSTKPLSIYQEKLYIRWDQKLRTLRRRVCRLLHSIFPELKYPKYFRTTSICVEAVLNQLISVLQGEKCQKAQAIPTEHSCWEVKIIVCKSPKHCLNNLRRKIVCLLQLILPELHLSRKFDKTSDMVDELLSKVIYFNKDGVKMPMEMENTVIFNTS